MYNTPLEAVNAAFRTDAQHNVTVGDKQYTIFLLNARDASCLGLELSKIVAPGIAAWIDGMKSEDTNELLSDSDLFISIVTNIILASERFNFSDMCDLLLDEIGVNNQKVKAADYFIRDIKTYNELLGEALKVNVGPFFTHYLEKVGLKIPSMKEAISKVIPKG